MAYGFVIVASVDDGYTSAEIIDANHNELAVVFEAAHGWCVQTADLNRLRDSDLTEAVLRARDELLHYPHRKGNEPPEGTSRAGLSLWLMRRDDRDE